jgi:hypothetical protein
LAQLCCGPGVAVSNVAVSNVEVGAEGLRVFKFRLPIHFIFLDLTPLHPHMPFNTFDLPREQTQYKCAP